MPVPENEEPSKSLPVALQSLFFRVGAARGVGRVFFRVGGTGFAARGGRCREAPGRQPGQDGRKEGRMKGGRAG